jgi:hypothetical protein
MRSAPTPHRVRNGKPCARFGMHRSSRTARPCRRAANLHPAWQITPSTALTLTFPLYIGAIPKACFLVQPLFSANLSIRGLNRTLPQAQRYFSQRIAWNAIIARKGHHLRRRIFWGLGGLPKSIADYSGRAGLKLVCWAMRRAAVAPGKGGLGGRLFSPACSCMI